MENFCALWKFTNIQLFKYASKKIIFISKSISIAVVFEIECDLIGKERHMVFSHKSIQSGNEE